MPQVSMTRRAWYWVMAMSSSRRDLLQCLQVMVLALRPISCGLPQCRQITVCRSSGVGTDKSDMRRIIGGLGSVRAFCAQRNTVGTEPDPPEELPGQLH